MKRSGNNRHRVDGSHQHLTAHHGPDCFAQKAQLELLMAEARLGNELALAELLMHHRPIIEKSVVRLLAVRGLATTMNIEKATDDTCDVARRLFATQYQTHVNMKGFRGWLRALLSNQVRDLLKYVHAGKRDRRREKPLNAAHDVPHGSVHHAPPDMVIAAEESRSQKSQLHAALAGLSDRDRQLILMRHCLGWPWAEIAEVLSMPSEAAAKTAGWRAMETIRGRMEASRQRA